MAAFCPRALLYVFAILGWYIPYPVLAQQNEAAIIRRCYDEALANGRAYTWLEALCKKAGHRLSGSAGAERAVRLTQSILDTVGLDSVWLQPVQVPHWERGKPEVVYVKDRGKKWPLTALALGGSVGTEGKRIQAKVVEVKSFGELERLGRAGIAGNIVFFNRPMDPTRIRTFEAYGGAVDQRAVGASKAAAFGAVGVLVRSMNLRIDDFPHTGTLHYEPEVGRIPAAAISTKAANQLHDILQGNAQAVVSMKMDCRNLPDAPSYNVVGELRGKLFPKTILLTGGHLDSWDVGEGAHDDGAGCVQSMEALRLLRRIGYQPRHTIRCVLFMNEENGTRGGHAYAARSKAMGERPLFSLESDAGGFAPRGFTFDASEAMIDSFYAKVKAFKPFFEPYNQLTFTKGGSGVDIGPLKDQNGLLCGYLPDSQRYFDFHHTAADVFEAVNERELALGAASIAALLYLVDKYGLD